jgi:heat shock protein HtpX
MEASIAAICLMGIAILLFLRVSAQNSSRAILATDAEPLDKQDASEVLASVRRLSGMAAVPTANIYRTSRSQIDTLSVGWSPSSSSIILNARVLETLTAEELASVIALEVGHIKYRDYLLRSIVIATAGLVYFSLGGMSLRILQVYQDIWNDIREGRKPHILSDSRIIHLPGIIIVPPFVMLALVIGIPIKIIVAQQEYRADAWSVQAVGSPLPLVSAITKLAKTGESSNNHLRDYSVFRVGEPCSRGPVWDKLRAFLYIECAARIRRLEQL